MRRSHPLSLQLLAFLLTLGAVWAQDSDAVQLLDTAATADSLAPATHPQSPVALPSQTPTPTVGATGAGGAASLFDSGRAMDALSSGYGKAKDWLTAKGPDLLQRGWTAATALTGPDGQGPTMDGLLTSMHALTPKGLAQGPGFQTINNVLAGLSPEDRRALVADWVPENFDPRISVVGGNAYDVGFTVPGKIPRGTFLEAFAHGAKKRGGMDATFLQAMEKAAGVARNAVGDQPLHMDFRVTPGIFEEGQTSGPPRISAGRVWLGDAPELDLSREGILTVGSSHGNFDAIANAIVDQSGARHGQWSRKNWEMSSRGKKELVSKKTDLGRITSGANGVNVPAGIKVKRYGKILQGRYNQVDIPLSLNIKPTKVDPESSVVDLAVNGAASGYDKTTNRGVLAGISNGLVDRFLPQEFSFALKKVQRQIADQAGGVVFNRRPQLNGGVNGCGQPWVNGTMSIDLAGTQRKLLGKDVPATLNDVRIDSDGVAADFKLSGPLQQLNQAMSGR